MISRLTLSMVSSVISTHLFLNIVAITILLIIQSMTGMWIPYYVTSGTEMASHPLLTVILKTMFFLKVHLLTLELSMGFRNII